MHALERLADRIDHFNGRLGVALSWLTLLLVLITGLVAILRYFFNSGWVWMQDAYLWVNGTMFLMGAAYTLLEDKHVRVDFIYQALNMRKRAAIDLIGTFVFLIPSILVIAWLCYPFVMRSWARLEGSGEAGGLPGIFLLKSVLLLFCLPLLAQAISMALRAFFTLAGRPGGRIGAGEQPHA